MLYVDPTGTVRWGSFAWGSAKVLGGAVGVVLGTVATFATGGAGAAVGVPTALLGLSGFYAGIKDIRYAIDEQSNRNSLFQDLGGYTYIGAAKVTGIEATQKGLDLTEAVVGAGEAAAGIALGRLNNAHLAGIKATSYGRGFYDPRTGQYISRLSGAALTAIQEMQKVNEIMDYIDLYKNVKDIGDIITRDLGSAPTFNTGNRNREGSYAK